MWFLLIVSMIAGTISYLNLGREEDPDFTIKTMIIGAALPGATIDETLKQVTTRIETKLEELDVLDFTRSVTTPGQAVVYVRADPTIREPCRPRGVKRVRQMMGDIRPEFPQEFAGFQFNDNFGDVFGNIYAFTADGFTPRELRDRVEAIRRQVAALDAAGKTELLGVQDEQVFLEFSAARLAALGLNQAQVIQTLAQQNAIAPSGVIQAGPERILVRVGGQFDGAESIEAVNLRVGERFFNLGDVATVTRGYQDPPTSLFRHNGQPAIGLQIGMRQGGNILEFGAELEALMDRIAADLPIGIRAGGGRRPAACGSGRRGPFRQGPGRGRGRRPGRQLHQPGPARGAGGDADHPAVSGDHFVILTGITLQRISGRADHRSWPAGRRCDDRHRDDDLKAGDRGIADRRGQLCLDLDRLSDADGDPGDGGGLYPHRSEQFGGG